MPTVTEHLNWAQSNEKFADSFYLDDQVEINWAITVLFYSAVHYVDAYLVRHNNKQPDHSGRDHAIINDDRLSVVWRHYKRLKDMSRSARYECAPYARKDVDEAKRRLGEVRAIVTGLLKI